MDSRRVIAERIAMGLRRHLGEGVDAQRTLDDARYARDVLLVCDALTATDLPALARQFRAATSGGGLSKPPAAPDAGAAKTSRPWYSPKRWFS
jgi:hypothetical protein